MEFRTLIIGRSRRADLRLGDRTVSRLHAEVTVTGSRRFYLTDRASLGGTWVYRNDRWRKHRQGYVEGREPVRFGACETDLSTLMASHEANARKRGRKPEGVSIRPKRNDSTGEVEFNVEQSR